MTYSREILTDRSDNKLDTSAYATVLVLDSVQSQTFTDLATFEDYWERRFSSAATEKLDYESRQALKAARAFVKGRFVRRLPEVQKHIFRQGYRDGYRSSWAAIGRAIMEERYIRYLSLGGSADPDNQTRRHAMPVILNQRALEVPIQFEESEDQTAVAREFLKKGHLGPYVALVYDSLAANLDPKLAIRSEDGNLIKVDFNYLADLQSAIFTAYNHQIELVDYLEDDIPGLL